jgi:hypothetical protein
MSVKNFKYIPLDLTIKEFYIIFFCVFFLTFSGLFVNILI